VPRAIVLVNPRSRSGGRAPIDRIFRAFRDAGWTAELWAGEGLDWVAEATQRAVALGVGAVFGAGGDGLLAAMLPALLEREVALGVVPLGTGNVWARELALPLDLEGAIAAQLACQPARVDLGRANGRLFLVIASVGFDAQIVGLVEAGSKALGQLAYPLAGVALAGAVRGVRCRIRFDDEPPRELELLAGLATNGRLYGGLVALAPEARLDDGLLDVVVFEGSGRSDAATHVARVLAGTHRGSRGVVAARVRRLDVESLGPPVPVQTDGDPRGTTPLQVEVLPQALLALGYGTRGQAAR
jgi:diacylglycerol kinase (ATP)